MEKNNIKVDKLLDALSIAVVALGVAHDEACSCCNSSESVKKLCDAALEKIEILARDGVLDEKD